MLNLQHVRDRLGPNFEPFIIRLTDGRSLEIPHPDFIAVGRGIVVLVDSDDRTHMIDPLQMVSLDKPASLERNGG